jgi:phosphatidylinositol-3-phosphatase
MSLRTRRTKWIALASAAALSVALSGAVVATTAADQDGGGGGGHGVNLDRVYVIMLENHGLNSVIGDPSAPYITSLAHTYAEATGYYGVTHPSEPNYVAMISGSNWDTNNDNPANLFDHTNLVDELQANHIDWGAYMEALPGVGSTAQFWPSSTNALYASKHNPFVLFPDILASPSRLANVKPYTSLSADLNGRDAPRFVFITPDQCNDMHGGVYGAVPGYATTPCPYNNTAGDPFDEQLKANADAFVKGAVSTITSSRAWTRHSAIFIVADEGDYTGVTQNGGWDSPAGCCDSPLLPAGDPDINAAWPGGLYGGGLVPAIVIDPSGPHHYVSSASYNHYSLLRTIEDAWGLPELGFTSDHIQVHTMNEFLTH